MNKLIDGFFEKKFYAFSSKKDKKFFFDTIEEIKDNTEKIKLNK